MDNQKKTYEQELNEFWADLRFKNVVLKFCDENQEELRDKLSQVEYMPFLGEELEDADFDFAYRFLNSVTRLSIRISNFYEDIYIPNIKLRKSKKVRPGEGRICGNDKSQSIILPDKQLTESDFLIICHELGHVPQFVFGMRDYYEYIEALPIFFEYLGCKELYPEYYDVLFKELIKKRCSSYSDTCLDIDYESRKEYNTDAGEKYCKEIFMEILKINNFRYIKSADIALQLIERQEENKRLFNTIIYDYITGYKPMREVVEDLDINTKDCKTLVKYVGE